MVIKIDSREQKPYHFETETVTGALPTGDYSLDGLEHLIAIERKSLPDLMGSLSTGRERFEKELRRGLSLRYFAIVIESTLAEIASGNYRSRMQPKAVIQSLLAMSVRFRMPVFFAESREYGARVTESLLLKFGREIEREAKAILVWNSN